MDLSLKCLCFFHKLYIFLLLCLLLGSYHTSYWGSNKKATLSKRSTFNIYSSHLSRNSFIKRKNWGWRGGIQGIHCVEKKKSVKLDFCFFPCSVFSLPWGTLSQVCKSKHAELSLNVLKINVALIYDVWLHFESAPGGIVWWVSDQLLLHHKFWHMRQKNKCINLHHCYF